jgi:hypothetical protein
MQRRLAVLLTATFFTLCVGATRADATGSAGLASAGLGDDDAENPLANTPPKHLQQARENEEAAAPSGDGGPTTRYRIWKWTAAGTSVAMLATGVLFMTRAGSQEEELKKTTGGRYSASVHELENGWRQNRFISYGAMTAGGLAAVTAFVLFVKDKPVESKTAFAPLVGPTFAGAQAQVRF